MSILNSANDAAWSLWGVELEGDNLSIRRIEKSLNQMLSREEDTFVSRLNSTPVLRSAQWNNIAEPAIVLQTAQLELNLLQGLAKLSSMAGPLTLGTIFKFRRGDNILCSFTIASGTIQSLAREFEGKLFTKRLALLRKNDPLSSAVLELNGAPDWYRIYKVVEYLEEFFGNGESGLRKALPTEADLLKRIKQTSQSLRHRARRFKEIINPSTLEDAEQNLVRIIKDLIDKLPSSDGDGKPYFKVIPRTYSEDFVIGIKPPKSEALHVGIEGDPI